MASVKKKKKTRPNSADPHKRALFDALPKYVALVQKEGKFLVFVNAEIRLPRHVTQCFEAFMRAFKIRMIYHPKPHYCHSIKLKKGKWVLDRILETVDLLCPEIDVFLEPELLERLERQGQYVDSLTTG